MAKDAATLLVCRFPQAPPFRKKTLRITFPMAAPASTFRPEYPGPVAPGFPSVADVIKGLEDSDVEKRRAASAITTWQRGKLGFNFGSGLPAIARALTDEDQIVRRNAVQALSGYDLAPLKSQSTSVVAAIEKLLSDDHFLTRCASLRCLESFGPLAKESLTAIRRTLKDDDEIVRIRAARAILSIAPNEEEAMSTLYAGLQVESAEVSREVVEAFAAAGIQTVGALRKGLKEDNPIVRVAAANSLGSMASRLRLAAARFPIEALNALVEGLSDKDTKVVVAITHALGLSAQCRVVDVADVIPGLVVNFNHTDTAVRFWSIYYLKDYGESAQALVPRLREIMENDRDELVRSSARRTLEELKRQYGPR